MEQRSVRTLALAQGHLLHRHRINRVDIGKLEERMLFLLLETESNVACWRDKNGLTPLHSAALLEPGFNLRVIKYIVERCPQSAEVCDSSGKSILHHMINRQTSFEDGINLCKCPDIRALRNRQDQQGNTPLHLAVIHKDIVMVNFLLNLTVNITITNKDGFSAATLIQQSKILEEIENRIMTKEESEEAENKTLSYFTEKGAIFGMYLLTSRDREGKNFLHKLLLTEKEDAERVPSGYVELLLGFLQVPLNIAMDTDNSGDTPFHVFARNDPKVLTSIIENDGEDDFYNLLWALCKDAALIPNLQGNTPLHEAIMAENDIIWIKYSQAIKWIDKSLIPTNGVGVNNRKEGVAHLLASRTPMPESVDESVISELETIAGEGLYFVDEDGLSPLMRAIHAGNYKFAERLYNVFPRSAEVRDPNGRTIWHYLVSLEPISYDIASSPFTKGVALCQLEKQDKDGNTPSHLAIEHRRFDLAELFLSQDESKTADGTLVFKTPLRDIRNKTGITPGDLIGSLAYLPAKFEEFIWNKSTMIGIRSMWGIPTTEMKDYVNTMGVIAALLTTITFTAAFTVPGGLNQEKGTPLLVTLAAFQVFMISNVLAMCLSMMVLFCLLWIMATGNKSKSVVLLDFSILLLLASFYTTLVTFMTGLYATTYMVKPWIAVVALVLCSMLLLLMHKYLVMKFVIPSGQAFLIFADKAIRYVHGLRTNLKFASCIKKCFENRCLTRSKSSASLPKSNSPSQPEANQPN